MRATILSHGRRGWAYGAQPLTSVHRAFKPDGQQTTWPVVPVKAQGEASMICAIKVPESEEPVVFGEMLKTDPSVPPPADFKLDPWCGDEPAKLMPELYAEDEAVPPAIRLVRATKVDQVFSVRRTYESGLILQTWLRFRHEDPAADVYGYVAWSNRQTDELDRGTLMPVIGFGELFWPEWMTHLSIRPWHHAGKWWVPLGGRDFIDGSSLPFRGTLLCGPKDGFAEGDDVDDKVRNLIKAAQGPQWFSPLWPHIHHWGAHKNLPVMQREAAQNQSIFEHNSWEGLINSPGGNPYEPRPLGLQPNAGSTGDQEAFGSTKGTWGLAGQPWWINQALWSVTGHGLRGFQHFEADGRRLKAEDHPGWKTWSGRTLHAVSSDTLGKPTPGWFDLRATGWTGMDDQHRSTLNATAVLALTGDEYVEDLLEHLVESDNAMVENRLGAPRAIGRLFLDWANMDRVLTGKAKSDTKRNFEKKQEVLKTQARAVRHSNPVKVMAYGLDPRYGVFDEEESLRPTTPDVITTGLDPVLTFNNGHGLDVGGSGYTTVIVKGGGDIAAGTYATVVVDPTKIELTGAASTGVNVAGMTARVLRKRPAPVWVVWEHALLLVGLYAAHKQYGLDPVVRGFMDALALTIVKYGTFLENGTWHYCATVHYPGIDTPEEGTPIDPGLYSTSSNRITWQLGGTGIWTLRAVMIAREILAGDLQVRANEIVRQKVSFNAPSNRRDAEWDACTRLWTPT